MRKASLVLEYAVLIAILVAALVCMQAYMKKTISGYWRESADSFGFGMQYEPGVTSIQE